MSARQHTRPPRCKDGYFDEKEGVVVNAEECSDPVNCAAHPDHSAAQSSQRRT